MFTFCCQTGTLTTSNDDVINGTTASDLITAAQGTLQGGDIILDNSTTDNDLFQATVTSTTTQPRLQNIERVEITGEYVSTGIDLGLSSNIQTLTLDTKIANGTASVLGANSLNAASIVAGDNIKTLNVSSLASGTRDAVSIDANNATAVNIKGSGSPDIYDVTIAEDATLTFDVAASGGDTLASAGDIVTVNVSGDATIDAAVTADNAELDLNIVNNTKAAEITLSDVSHINAEKMAISGSQNVTLVTTDGVALAGTFTAGAQNYDGTAITSSSTGTVTLEISALQAGTLTTANDFSMAAVDVIELSGEAADATAITLNDATTLHLTADIDESGDGSDEIVIGLDNGDANEAYTKGSLVTKISEKQSDSIETAATVETLLMSVEADEATDTDLDENGTEETTVTLADVTLNAATTAFVISGDENIALTNITVAAADQTITASGLTGKLTISDLTGAFDATIIGGSNNDSIYTSLGEVYDIQTGAGNDTVSVAANSGTAAADNTEVSTGTGNDTVYSSTDITVIDLGAGDDTVTTAGKDTITLGDGADVIKLGDNLATVIINDFVMGTDIIELQAATVVGNINVTDLADPTSGLYKIADANGILAANEYHVTLKNGGSALTATDFSSSMRLSGVTLANASTNVLGDLDDSVKLADNTSATITTGDGSDTVTLVNAAAETAVVVKDFTVGTDKIVLEGALDGAQSVNLANVVDSSGVYGIGDTSGTLYFTVDVENGGSDISTNNDLRDIVQLGTSATNTFAVNGTGTAVSVTGGSFNDFIEVATFGAGAVVNFANNGGVDAVILGANDGSAGIVNFNGLTGIDSAQGKVFKAANATKVTDATDGAIYVFEKSSDGAGSVDIDTFLVDSANGYTQEVIDDQIAAFINAGLGVSAGESYVVVINDTSTIDYAATAYGNVSGYQYESYVYLVTGDADGVQADNVQLIGMIDDGTSGNAGGAGAVTGFIADQTDTTGLFA